MTRTADIIILLESGQPTKEYLVENEITAEAQFDELCEEVMGEDYEDVLTHIDYGFRYNQARRYLNKLGKDIIWLNRVEINEFVNPVE